MKQVFFVTGNIITSLGFDTEEHAKRIAVGESGVRRHSHTALSRTAVYASLVDSSQLDDTFKNISSKSVTNYTRLEKLIICSVSKAIASSGIPAGSPRSLFILSTTKGNVHLLEQENTLRNPSLNLWHTAQLASDYFGFTTKPLVVSSACISGLLAINTAARYIRNGLADHVVVCGADILSEFIVSGFQSFQSLAPEVCKPFDTNRNGLSLGEGCGTIILSADSSIVKNQPLIQYMGGASANDANHISGPSREGEGLYLATMAALSEARLHPSDIDFISAHGTATPFNDEMETQAITRAGLNHVPVNSFKGYFGHTLGAAGVIETLLSIYSLQHNIVFGTYGFDTLGVTQPINVQKLSQKKELKNILKFASGFGGCNAAAVFSKI
jgi:3-oxoacyl-[acyl-carrier-protein] synthase-1